jgi:acyl-CoA reductase-like NAD-dependent aldehyde dehydrogenase
MNSCPTQLFRDGAFASGRGHRLPQINPATEELFTEVESASVEDVDAAARGAHQAFEKHWRDMAPGKRTEVLFAIAAAIRRHAEAIAQLESRNVGKPISDARDEVALGARIFEYYAGAVTKFGGQTVPVASGGFDFTLRQPLGVVAAIVPWNFPFPIACWKVAPA